MFHKISEKTFYQYVKCPNWVYFDLHAQTPRAHDPLMNQLIDDGLLDEKQRALISDRQEVVEVMAEDPDEAFRQTLAFMREGKQTIYHGVLIDQHWVGHPDVLERVEGESSLGFYYYVAADIKRSRYIKDEYKFQGCFYAELLYRLQGVRPVMGYVITPDKETLTYTIDEFEAAFHLSLIEIEKIVAGIAPAHFVTSGCKQSPWFSECRAQSEACDDLSLLNRVWREEVARLQECGITTIAQLAQTPFAKLQNMVPMLSVSRLEIMHDQAIAIRTHQHIIRTTVDLPAASVELYFDIESDPLRDFDYLFGVLEVSERGEEYHAFMAASPEQEGAMWVEFCDFLTSHFESPVYHYGAFEQEVVNRFAAKYGVSPMVQDVLEQNFIDILEIVRPSIIFPLSFYSLKDIAQYIGFSWRSADASGANSVLWFEDWLRTKNPALLQKITEYNEDDVRATHVLKVWLHKYAT